MNIKQYVVVRKDLQMSPGLLSAQVAHISAQIIVDRLKWRFSGSKAVSDWIKMPYLVVLGVNNNEELQHLVLDAEKEKLKTFIWFDTIYLHNIKRSIYLPVGASFGPDDSDKLKRVLGEIPLL